MDGSSTQFRLKASLCVMIHRANDVVNGSRFSPMLENSVAEAIDDSLQKVLKAVLSLEMFLSVT